MQIESTPAVVLSALGDSFVTGTPDRPDRFKSNGLDGGPADAVAALFSRPARRDVRWRSSRSRGAAATCAG